MTPGGLERSWASSPRRCRSRQRSSSWLYKLQQNKRSHNSRPHPVPSSTSPPRMSNTPIPCGPALAPRLINGIGKGSHLLEPCVWVWGTPARSSSHVSVEIFFGRLPINKQPVVFFFFFFFLQWETFGLLCLIPLRKEEKKKKSPCVFDFALQTKEFLKRLTLGETRDELLDVFQSCHPSVWWQRLFPDQSCMKAAWNSSAAFFYVLSLNDLWGISFLRQTNSKCNPARISLVCVSTEGGDYARCCSERSSSNKTKLNEIFGMN